MRQVELYTDDGRFVAVVEIVPFPDRGMPKVIMWGDRVFVRALQDPPSQDFDPLRDRWPFREAFSVVSFTPSPGLPRETVSGPGPKSSARELLQSKAAEKGGAMMPIPPVDRSAGVGGAQLRAARTPCSNTAGPLRSVLYVRQVQKRSSHTSELPVS